jgi:pimeloyl-ACP methyl ester carboxylesterase
MTTQLATDRCNGHTLPDPGHARRLYARVDLPSALAYDNLPSHWLRTATGDVCYIDAGQGPAVVMFHGSPLFSFEFRAQIVSLAQHFRVIAPDLLWFGRSTGPVGGADFTTQAGAMLELLDHLDLQRFHLVAHDWGGPIGLGAAARTPEKIDRLVLLNTSIRSDLRPPWYWHAFTAPGLAELLLIRANAFGRGLPLLLRSARNRTVWRRYIQPLKRRETRQTVLLLERQRGFAELCQVIGGALRRMAGPKLIIWGEPDPCFPRGERQRLQALLPDARVRSLSGAGHFANEDASDRVTEECVCFLAE